ncbi:MAG: adenine phosphoribosyltransferase [SAR324 cluster bacterium]|uniref:Adenine phosphoribosyltransferase n=1 Tax=SAR324 cluster bacterium TaxID=2024889 RepID=A0A2A4T6K4_9DELT|nr:MAG: adenine phosphoribosyltransferase [SAR324 cluster bacterium]
MEHIKSLIRNIPDFPKPGIQFKDVTTLFQDRWGLKKCLDLFEEKYRYQPIDKVAGVDSRGFIVGAALADRLGCGFVTIRKKGKLPWETISESYDLEYGTDDLEVHVDSIQKGERILLIDDLLATGGTLSAAVRLIERLEGEIIGISCVIELAGLKGQEKLGDYPFHSLVSYDEM